jgi:hypothetical protein
MMFRRAKPQKFTLADYVKQVRDAGFETQSMAGGRVKVLRGGIAAVIDDGGGKARVFERAGMVLGDEIGTLVDGGFQKFFQTASGVRKPAVATELKAIHEFQEDLREALGLTSLYNESLGSVSNLYLYDRVVDRDSSRAKKPWELKIRGQNAVTKV